MVIACDQTITLVQHTTENDGDTYTCTPLEGASWFSKTVITTSGDGAAPANTYEVRIFSGSNIAPKPGDYVARGIVKDVTKPADLKSVEHFRIKSVGDNRRGGLPHWRVSGS